MCGWIPHRMTYTLAAARVRVPKKPPPLPPLPLESLVLVEKLERYARDGLRACGAGQGFFMDFNVEKALRILRTCCTEVVKIEIKFYVSLPAYRAEWFEEIKRKTIASAVGLVPYDSNCRETIRSALKDTLDEIPIPNRSVKAEKPKENIPSRPAPIASELRILLDESRVTAEELAEEIDLDVRSVYRHLKETPPRKRQIAAYEKFFSARLGRKIRLNTSPKRQGNVRETSP
jgi:DNA-binding transcriptional ArsR family regulator